MTILNRLFGANIQTSLSGIAAGITGFLSIVSTLSLTAEGQAVISFLSPEAKAKVAIGSAAAALAFRFWSSFAQKDRNVTGGTIQQDAVGSVADPQKPTPPPPQPATP